MLAYCVDFPCNPPRIAAENCLVCGAKILAIRCTPLTKTASQQKRRFVLPRYHAILLNRDYRIARFAPFGKRKTDFFAFCPQTAPFRSGFRCICTKDSPPAAAYPLSHRFAMPAPGLRHPASASLSLASCWPLPQQLLPVSAAGGGRRRCPKGGAIGRPGNSVLTAGSSIWHKI